jgi:hypothetical protein
MRLETGIQRAEETKKYQEFKDLPLCPMNNFGVCKEGRCAWFDAASAKCAVLLLAQAIAEMDLRELG